ncbi:MAG: MarR family transcriptional regulator [Sulfurospirillaceae bacterium]|nr:MarR family transcriptional regulator [Sulfurospirillaceae bacterium]
MPNVKCEDYLDCCLYFVGNTLSRVITKMTEEVFMPTGLAPSYAFLLMIVNESDGITQNELADKLNISPSTVSRFLDKLIVKKLVEKKIDGKATVVLKTKKSLELQPIIKASWKNLYQRYSEILGDDFAMQLTKDMAKANQMLKSID